MLGHEGVIDDDILAAGAGEADDGVEDEEVGPAADGEERDDSPEGEDGQEGEHGLAAAVARDGALLELEGGDELGGELRLEPLKLLPGDALDLYLFGGELVVVVQHVDPRGAAFDRAHKRGTWTRFKSDEELRKAVATRLPGFSFESFEILSRGVSGRVGKIRLDSTTGESLEVEGLPVRWTLDVPDTFFTARRLTPKSGPHGWQFAGRGWGHGVGLCQTGAVGMARRGHAAAAILQHYYRGARIERVESEPLP